MTRTGSIAALLLAACSGTHDLAGDVSSYQQLASDAVVQLQAYCASASGMSSGADCAAALRRYLDHIRPDVAGMMPLAGPIDDRMMGMGMPAGDMRCGAERMSGELEHHAGVACASADMNANRSEAMGHCEAMGEYLDHMRMRGAEAGGMMGGGMMGHASDGGWTMPDGGRMDWDHPMPGCPMHGG